MADINAKEHFRTALHGFNREDVITFVEENALAQEKQRRQWEEETAQLRKQLEEARNGSPASPAQTVKPSEDNEIWQKCEALDAENRLLQMENERLQEALAEARATHPSQAEPAGKEIETLRDQELEAYRRAEQVERVARERAAEIYRQLGQTLNCARAQFNAKEGELARLGQGLQEHIEQMRQTVNSLQQSYSQIWQGLEEANEEADSLASAHEA